MTLARNILATTASTAYALGTVAHFFAGNYALMVGFAVSALAWGFLSFLWWKHGD